MSIEEDAIQKYSDLVYRLALMKVQDRHIADDVFQDVFLKYMKYKDTFHDEAHEKAWIIKVTINTCKTYFLSNWKRKMTSMDQEIPVLRQEHSELYYQVMELPDKYRLPLFLFYYEGYSIKEIATQLHRKETTIKTQLKRGRSLLKDAMKGDDPFEQLSPNDR